jgi:hypothetical protein
MSTGARRAGARTDDLDRAAGPGDREVEHKPRRSLAQWFCLVAGIGLLLGGLLGMTADNNFDSTTTDPNGVLQGDGFLGFEVNGWHNLVHILSGLFLLVGFFRHGLAKTFAIVFGVVYAVLLVIGLVNGNDILGFVPVNPADNVLHGVLALLGLGAGLLSKRPKGPTREQGAPHRDVRTTTSSGRERVDNVPRDTGGAGRGRTRVVAPAEGDGVDHRDTLRPGR